ncbi:MAG: type II toxin-antitoxin system HicA family toxin [Candidatus Atribacteria bacterium]|nr:type II toxin-antitoxin system HicA family toxin [Candidatus Atribacteria bacterium]
MHKLPIIKGREFIKFLQSLGFKIVRTKGSHVRLRTEDQKRVTTIPIHKNKDIPKGLLRTIIREDLEISLEEFCKLYSKYKEKK